MQPAVCPRCRNPTPMPPPSNCATCGEPFKKAVVIPLTPAIGTSGPRVARLAGRLADGKVGDFTLGEKTTLGRHPNNAMRLLDREVSKEHAVIQRVSGSYVLRDLDSSNGTFVNGRRIRELKLRDGDELVLGNCRLVFHAGNGEPPSSPRVTVVASAQS